MNDNIYGGGSDVLAALPHSATHSDMEAALAERFPEWKISVECEGRFNYITMELVQLPEREA